MEPIEIVKKIGAGLIIVILAIMMAITFSSQPIDEITSVIAGGSKIGTYDGKDISQQIFAYAMNNCRQRFESFGNIPDSFINQCAASQLKEIYALSSIGESLGLTVSRETTEKEVLESVQELHRQQQAMDEEDRLSIEEIYRREIATLSIQGRRLFTSAILASKTLVGKHFPIPEDMASAGSNSTKTALTFNVVSFSNAELLQKLDTAVAVSEAEIRAEYDREQKLLEGDKKAPYESRKEVIVSRLKTLKKQERLSGMKERLSRLSEGYSLAEITSITGIPVQKVGPIKLRELASARVGNQTLNLAAPGILTDLKPGRVTGPHQSNEYTVYAQLTSINTASGPSTERAQFDDQIASSITQNLLDQEAKRKKFSLNFLMDTKE
jgi:hypothetical protein